MDPLTSLVTALAAGAAAALQSTVEHGVKDGYAALKGLITRKYAQVDLDQLEANPFSKNRRGVVEEDLKAAGVETDTETLDHSRKSMSVGSVPTNSPPVSRFPIHIRGMKSTVPGVPR
jgi:hypothetical protein